MWGAASSRWATLCLVQPGGRNEVDRQRDALANIKIGLAGRAGHGARGEVWEDGQ